MYRKLFALSYLATLAQAVYIVPGAHWRDTNGNLVNAHAGGVNYDEETKTFWLFGEYKVEGHTEGGGIRVYSSKDLAEWKDHGLALAPIKGHPRIDPSMVIQRPKVAYAQSTGKYNMWWHADAPNRAYNWLLQGHAIADNYSGPYTYVDAYQPLGNWSQDFGLFTDPDTKRSYAMYSNGDRREGRDVYLTSYNEDVTHLDQVVFRWDKSDLEAPSIVKTEVGYFAIMSHKTGYRPNNVVAYHADKLEGPWSQPWIVNPLNTRGLNSQSGNTLTIRGSKKTTHLYLGDRWDLNANWEATYVWLPFIIDSEKKSLKIEWIDVYDLDVQTGEWTAVEGHTYYSADATLKGNAFHQEAARKSLLNPFASNGTIATGISGNDSTITFQVEGEGDTDDMGFGDSPFGSPDRIGGIWILRRYGWVEVNNDPATRQQLSMKDTHKGIIMASPLALNLTQGLNNITLGGLSNGNGTKAADVDKIIVFPLETPTAGNASSNNPQTSATAQFTGSAPVVGVSSLLCFAAVLAGYLWQT